MSNSIAGSGGNSTSSVKSFFKDVGKATNKFGDHLVKGVEDVYVYTIGDTVYRLRKCIRLLKDRKASIENDEKTKYKNAIDLIKEKSGTRYERFKKNLKSFFTNDTVRHFTKFLLFAAGTALFIVGMFFPPVSAIAALTILGIAVTRFIFKTVHIIKQAKVESKLTENKLVAKTMFKLLIAAAEIPAFFFGGPLASLITQPISGAILGIMKAYDDIETEKRMDKTQKWDNAKIDELDDYDDNVELEGGYSVDYKNSNTQNESYNTQYSTNLDTSSKENSANNMYIDYA